MIGGPIQGTRYRFDERMLCLIGRAGNSTLQLTGEAGEGVSRHHCLLDLQPPSAFIRDLASRNGTLLNGVNIGKTESNQDNSTLETHPLASGDVFQIGRNVFRIELFSALKCRICHKVLPDGEAETEAGEEDPRGPLCPQCRAAGLKTPVSAAAETLRIRNCRICGVEFTTLRNTGETLCQDCRKRVPDAFSTWKMPENAEAPDTLLHIPGYKVLRQIGRGGMGAVYLAQSRETLEKVAVKVLLPDVAVHESCRDDFIREAENLKQLRHPNIIELKQCSSSGGALYLVLEYCSGGTLREYLNRQGKVFDLPVALNLLYQILDALDYAHHTRLTQFSMMDAEPVEVSGLVHRDIKPENIFIWEGYGGISAKIADFGISKAYDLAGISGWTRTGDFSGTLGFIPKQQFLNFKYVKPEVDVWAAAATFFYMLTGKPPRRFSPKEDIAKLFEEHPIPVRALNPDIPLPIAQTLHAALEDRRELKFKSAAALKFAMQDAAKKASL